MTAADSAVARRIAPSGAIRAGVNIANTLLVQRDDRTGLLGGTAPDLARELASRLAVDVLFVPFEAAGAMVAAARAGELDLVFIASDPARAGELAFTAPYALIEGGYLVRQESPFRHAEEVDREGVGIGVREHSAYDLALSRTLKKARVERGADGIEVFLERGLDVAAGIRPPLVAYAASHPGLRVLEGRFMEIGQAIGMPRDRGEAACRYVADFVEDMKATGFVARCLARSGQTDASVAPPGSMQN